MRPPGGKALVQGIRVPGIIDVAKGWATVDFSENARRLLAKVRVAVTSKERILLVQVVIPARVPLFAVERQSAVSFVIVVRSGDAIDEGADRIGSGEIVKESKGLRREAARIDAILDAAIAER